MQEGAQGRVKGKHREQEPRSREGTAENRTEEGKTNPEWCEELSVLH